VTIARAINFSRSASVSLFIAGRYFSTATVPGVFLSGVLTAGFFGLLTRQECIRRARASTGTSSRNDIREHRKTSIKSAEVLKRYRTVIQTSPPDKPSIFGLDKEIEIARMVRRGG
jgi:hypothetical protein